MSAFKWSLRSSLFCVLVFVTFDSKASELINRSETLKKNYVVLVSVDGFRADYVDLYHPAFLNQLKSQGSFAKAFIPIFPSETFPSHYSIITGLYPVEHGIVANGFYDPKLNAEYHFTDKKSANDGRWYDGEPLWLTAQRQGMLAATYFWVGSEADIHGQHPSYYKDFTKNVTHEEKVNQVKDWLSLPEEKRPHFITVYFHDVDMAGHLHGPNSKEVRDAVLHVDRTLDKLHEELGKLPIHVNLFVVSDHGMASINLKNQINLDDLADLKGLHVAGHGSQVMIYVKDSKKRDHIYHQLHEKENHFKVYKKENIPASLHYAGSERVGDLLVLADFPHLVGSNGNLSSSPHGNHGWDPDRHAEMHGIFFATGPEIQEGVHLDGFRNIHLYPLLLRLLGLEPPTHISGDIKVLESLLKTPSTHQSP